MAVDQVLFLDRPVLINIINESKLMQEERKKITTLNLALVLVHDVLLSSGIQAGDGPIKQAILRHKTRLHGEFQRIKIKRGVKSNAELVESGDPHAGLSEHFDKGYLVFTFSLQYRYRAMFVSTQQPGLQIAPFRHS
jgi:hypothetical protein